MTRGDHDFHPRGFYTWHEPEPEPSPRIKLLCILGFAATGWALVYLAYVGVSQVLGG